MNDLKEKSMVQNSVDLSQLNTLKLQSACKQVVTLTHQSQVAGAVASLQHTPCFVLSGGSNVLLPSFMDAVVIRPCLRGICVTDQTDTHVQLWVGAGEPWQPLVAHTVFQGWYGLENLAWIPGWAGAAPVQNIGAYGTQIDTYIQAVDAWHLPTAKAHRLSNKEAEFGYRDSLFKRAAGEWLITGIHLRLHKDPTCLNLGYADLKERVKGVALRLGRQTPTPADVMQAVIDIRKSKLPDPKVTPNCGSFFKNPQISVSHFNALKGLYPKLPGYVVDDNNIKVAAGWLIEQSGLKGHGVAPMLTHANQALVLTNQLPTLATQIQVAIAQHFIQTRVHACFGIWLEREPVWVESTGSISSSWQP